MKRCGEAETRKVLKDGGFIEFRVWYLMEAGYRLYDVNNNKIGYITVNLFFKLFEDDTITRVYSYNGIERYRAL